MAQEPPGTPPTHTKGTGLVASPPKLRRLDALDGLRAVAILMVVSGHYNLGLFSSPVLGVDVFFVLSGYLITTLLLRERLESGRIRIGAFIGRRARRLLPAMVVATGVIIVGSLLEGDPTTLEGLRRGVVGTLTYTSNLVHYGTSPNMGPLGFMWSLAAEEQFYLVWPTVLVLALRHPSARRLRVVMLTLLVLVALQWGWSLLLLDQGATNHALYAPDTRPSGLLVGCALAFLHVLNRHRERSVQAWRAALTSALGLLLLLPALLGGVLSEEQQLLRLPLVVLGTALVVHATSWAHPDRFLSPLLGSRVPVFLGRISYSAYLYNFLCLALAGLFASTPGARTALALTSLVVVSTLSALVLEGTLGRRFHVMSHLVLSKGQEPAK